ncbi:classical arabinogalactan protein 9-like [Ananas comosus]|uniref:Classical arabinogalactan protein 9-like n=1 Tax=Ananas comosus TaxID=4615 RepID=A0A6P5EN23_ANACO|nr:classical arabinogalactan protein 9-like [Ananas comosus]
MAVATSHPSRSLPYGSLLTAVLEFMSFDLSDVRPMKYPTAISTATFSTLGFKKNRHGIWVRKHVIDSPSEHGDVTDDAEDDPMPYEPPPRAPSPPVEPPPRASPPPFEPPPAVPPPYAPPPMDFQNQTDVFGIKAYMDSIFGPSSAFYAAYGPHVDRPSSSTMPPPVSPTDHEDDEEDDDDDDD